jgi:hypothetical protein
MTGYTVHTGSTVKFSSSWDRIFAASLSKKSDHEGEKTKKMTGAKPPQKSAKKMAANSLDLPAKAKKAVSKKSSAKSVKR